MPRPKEHVVTLTGRDRSMLTRVVSSGMHPARMIARARILLALDETGGPAPDRRVVAEKVGVSEGTVYAVAKRFTQSGGDVQAVIGRKKRAEPPVPAKVTGDVEARVIALACTKPPPGYDRWSLRLLEKHVVLTDGIPPLDHSTIGQWCVTPARWRLVRLVPSCCSIVNGTDPRAAGVGYGLQKMGNPYGTRSRPDADI